MKKRTTRGELNRALALLEKMLGTKLELDNMNPGDGRTYKVMDDAGRCPLGAKRRHAGEMLETMFSVICALEYNRGL